MGLKAGWLALFVFVWIVGALLGSTFEYQHTEATWAGTGTGGYSQSPITTLEYLTNISNAVMSLPVLGGIPLPIPNPEYFSAIYKVLTWDFAFLHGYELFKWIFIYPFVIMGVLSLILLVYGVITGNLTIG